MEFITDSKANELIEKAINLFYEKDIFLLENDVSERAITHRIGMYLQQIVGDSLDVDCEYNRMGRIDGDELCFTGGDYFAKTICLSGEQVSDESDLGSRVFPDIILHKRGTAQNKIIIEVKVVSKKGDREHDLKKLRRYKKDLKYEHAFFIELFKNKEKNTIQLINY